VHDESGERIERRARGVERGLVAADHQRERAGLRAPAVPPDSGASR